jgi:hypothetical protein
MSQWKSCPDCGKHHDPSQPHDASTMRFQRQFHQRFDRLPTWEDAFAHCSADVRQLTRAQLMENGINPQAVADMNWDGN